VDSNIPLCAHFICLVHDHLQFMLQWRVGAPCCAVYSGDGIIYEATIAALFLGRGTCLLKYVGKYINKRRILSLVI
jgi:hypothetical protein